MKSILNIFILITCFNLVFAQVGIGTTTPDGSSVLELNSSDKGFLVPRMTSVDKGNISSPAVGLMIYQTDVPAGFYYYNGSGWTAIPTTAGGTEWTTNGLNINNTNSGNVGVGVTTPIEKLQINDPSNTQGGIKLTAGTATGTSGTDGLSLVVNSSGSSLISYENSALYLGTNSANMMTINFDGNVGIGTLTPGYKLEVSGRIRSTGINETSDRRYKKDITSLTNVLSKVVQMRGVTYKWKTNEFPNKNFENDTQIGLIAQEVEALFPELVETDSEGYKSVEYSKIVAILIESIKELQTQVTKQSAENASMKADIEQLKSAVNGLIDANSQVKK